MVESTDWLARGGTYYVLAGVCVVAAAVFYVAGVKVGNQSGKPNDGCLYGICNIILALFGGGVGFLVLVHHYPYFILSSAVGAIGCPAVGLAFMAKKLAPR